MNKLTFLTFLIPLFLFGCFSNDSRGRNAIENTNIVEMQMEDLLNETKVNYIKSIAEKVKKQWRYQGAEDRWGCDVYILQDLNGKVQSVNIQSCNVTNNAKAKVFKDSIERAVYKASPLPPAPDKIIYDHEILFHFKIAVSPITGQDIKTDLPMANAKIVDLTEQQPTIITINKEGEYFINSLDEGDSDEKVSLGIIAGRVSARLEIYPSMKVFVRRGKSVATGSVASLVSFLQKYSANKVGIVTESNDVK